MSQPPKNSREGSGHRRDGTMLPWSHHPAPAVPGSAGSTAGWAVPQLRLCQSPLLPFNKTLHSSLNTHLTFTLIVPPHSYLNGLIFKCSWCFAGEGSSGRRSPLLEEVVLCAMVSVISTSCSRLQPTSVQTLSFTLTLRSVFFFLLLKTFKYVNTPPQ